MKLILGESVEKMENLSKNSSSEKIIEPKRILNLISSNRSKCSAASSGNESNQEGMNQNVFENDFFKEMLKERPKY